MNLSILRGAALSAAVLFACTTAPLAPARAHEAHRAAADAEEVKLGDLIIAAPWSRATPGGAKVAGGYMTISNTGKEPDRLIGGTFPLAGRFEVHEMAVKDGIMTMRPLEQGLEIPPGKTVTLAPGGYHLMFMDLKEPLTQGMTVTGTLKFEKAGTVDVTYEVRSIGAGAGTSKDMDHGTMQHDMKMPASGH